MNDPQISANTRKCTSPKCRNKGHKWIVVDPDILPFVLCKKHLIDFQIDLYKTLNKQKKVKP